MSAYMSYQKAVRVAIAVAVVAGLSACGSANATGPAEPADVSYSVRVRFDTLTVMGSCDHNSIFESGDDGEFDFEVTVADKDGARIEFRQKLSTVLKEGAHRLTGAWETVVRRQDSKPIGLRIHFWASERDGLLGNDPAMSNKNRWVTHAWNGTDWSGDRRIELVTGSASSCGVRIRYSITTTPIA